MTLINIACCFDTNFELAFAVLANSIERSSSSSVVLYALHDGPLRYAKRLVAGTNSFRCVFRDISAVMQRYPAHDRHSNVNYAKLQLGTLLPEVRRVIYLDADTIVLRDLTELFQTDLGHYCVAATTDYPFVVEVWRDTEGAFKRGFYYDLKIYVENFIELSDPVLYCNSGVFLLDLPSFANRVYQSRIEEFLSKKHSRAIFNDQDALNYALRGEIKILDPRWNAMNNLNFKELDLTTRTRVAAIEKLYADPFIIHFAGKKPWRSIEEFASWQRLFWDEARRDPRLGYMLLIEYLQSMAPPKVKNVERFVRHSRKLGFRSSDAIRATVRRLFRPGGL